MALDLRANTAVDVLIGPFVDITDGATSEAGETPAIVLSKNGQALAAKNDATVPVYDSVGYYNCELDATDTNTEGTLVLVAPVTATALPVRHEYNVLSEAAWDSLYVAKDDGFMDVNVKTIGRADTQETEANNLESACANYSATRGLTGTALPAAAANAAGGVPVSIAGGLDLDTILGRITGNVALASVLGALADVAADGDPTNADTVVQYLKQIINTIEGTAGLPAFPAAAAPANAVSLAEVIRAIHVQLGEVDNDGTAISHSGAMKLILSTLTGKSGGGGTNTITFRDIADTKNRISATVDANGNRTAVGTRDAT